MRERVFPPFFRITPYTVKGKLFLKHSFGRKKYFFSLLACMMNVSSEVLYLFFTQTVESKVSSLSLSPRMTTLQSVYLCTKLVRGTTANKKRFSTYAATDSSTKLCKRLKLFGIKYPCLLFPYRWDGSK